MLYPMMETKFERKVGLQVWRIKEWSYLWWDIVFHTMFESFTKASTCQLQINVVAHIKLECQMSILQRKWYNTFNHPSDHFTTKLVLDGLPNNFYFPPV